MNYKIIDDKKKKEYHIKETATGYIIETFTNFSDAKKHMKFLNLGGSFDGFTPEFMLRKSSTLLNRNSKNM